jgi:tRNA(fMet)-specific endonuclease VapC
VRYLLDTTVLSDFARGVPAVLDRLKTTSRRDVAISVITAMEVEYGLRLSPSRARRIREAMQALLADVRVLSYEPPDALASAGVRAALRKKSTPIGPYDVLIAGVALRHGLTLVTSNAREFSRVSGLLTEDWRTPLADR